VLFRSGVAGLLDNRTQAQLSKVPGIGDIPILGNLFRSRSVTRSNSELIVLVTPHVVDPVKSDVPPPIPPANPMRFLDNPDFDKNLPYKPSASVNNNTVGRPAPSAK